jgi:hypothetical protein
MLPFPHIPEQYYFGYCGYPLRIQADLARSLILMLTAVQEYLLAINGAARGNARRTDRALRVRPKRRQG